MRPVSCEAAEFLSGAERASSSRRELNEDASASKGDEALLEVVSAGERGLRHAVHLWLMKLSGRESIVDGHRLFFLSGGRRRRFRLELQ